MSLQFKQLPQSIMFKLFAFRLLPEMFKKICLIALDRWDKVSIQLVPLIVISKVSIQTLSYCSSESNRNHSIFSSEKEVPPFGLKNEIKNWNRLEAKFMNWRWNALNCSVLLKWVNDNFFPHIYLWSCMDMVQKSATISQLKIVTSVMPN